MDESSRSVLDAKYAMFSLHKTWRLPAIRFLSFLDLKLLTFSGGSEIGQPSLTSTKRSHTGTWVAFLKLAKAWLPMAWASETSSD